MDEIERQQRIEIVLGGLAQCLGPIIQERLGPMGFALMIFEFSKPGIGHYVSNAQRDDMIKALRELADRLEANEDIPPGMGPVQ